MQSAAKILSTLNDGQDNQVAQIASKAVVDGVTRFLENDGVASDFPQLSQKDMDDYIADLKRILAEENIPNDKHETLINCFVDFMNYYLENANKITSDNLEQWGKEKKAYEQTIYSRLAAIGYSETHPDYMRIALRTAQLPLQQTLQSILVTKQLAITLESAGLSAKDFVNTFDASSSDSSDESDDSDNDLDDTFSKLKL